MRGRVRLGLPIFAELMKCQVIIGQRLVGMKCGQSVWAVWSKWNFEYFVEVSFLWKSNLNGFG